MARIGLVPKEAMVKRIGSAYAGASRSIVSILRDLNPDTYTAAAGGHALARVRAIVEQLNMKAAEWARRSVKAAYQESRGIAETRLEAIGAQRPRPKKGAKAGSGNSTGGKRHDRAIARAVKRTTRDYLKANRTILVTAGRYLSALAYARKKLDDYREASVQAFTAEVVKDFIQKTVAGALTARSKYNAGEASLTSKDVSAKIRTKLLDQIGGGDFIIVNGKNYNLKSYAELVARTRMRESQTEAVKELCEAFDNDLVEIPRHDNPCEEICAEYQGKVYSISGKHPSYPELPDGGPPWHPNCVLPGTRVKAPGGIITGLRAWYDGQAVELTFSQGTRLAVTVNHMLLTPHGFAPAHLLREGDDVFYCPGFEGIGLVNPNEDGIPPLIEDVFQSLLETRGMSSSGVPVAPEYLHGDGGRCNGQVDIVRANGLLENDGKPVPPQAVGQNALDARCVTLQGLFFPGDLTPMFRRLALTADGIMGGRRAPSPFFLTRPGGGNPMGLAKRPESDPAFNQTVSDNHPADRVPFSQIDTAPIGAIQTTKLVDIKVFNFSGHVYDLHTSTSLYVCNSILSSNCECTMNPTSENALRWRNK